MKIKVPATSANLGVGFDVIGLSFDLFNEFKFSISDTTSLIGFGQYSNKETNLVYQAYKAFCDTYDYSLVPIRIELLTNDIPESRGLGSSASCILAGVFAANELTGGNKSFLECVAFSSEFEGHPDNIFAAAYGGLVSVFKEKKHYIHQTFDINNAYKFTLLIPGETGNTKTLRTILPETLTYEACVLNLSRIIQLPKAFKKDDILYLKTVLDDALHEPYRFDFIPVKKEITKLKENPNLVVKLSGSGPTLLVISTQDITPFISEKVKQNYQVLPVSSSTDAKISVQK
ncbi:MAG: homoserine kinase [Candidatus Izimaplasma sp.]|nr:homoserine kinase [Candidatus Izimaplasma bacterium]